MPKRFVIMDDKDKFRADADDLREAHKKADSLAEREKGTVFITYQLIRNFAYATDEQKADKEFWG